MLDYRVFRIDVRGRGGASVDNQSYRDNIYGQLGSVLAGDNTQGVFTTGSFAFTEADIKQVITNWLDIADSYNESIVIAYDATQVDGPGLDFASKSFADMANRSGQSLVQYLQTNKAYCVEQAQLAQNALDDYLGIERRNVTEIYKTDPQGPAPIA